MEQLDSYKKGPLARSLLARCPKGFELVPTEELYNAIGINKHRFAKIWRGEKEPTGREIKVLADYFQLDILDFFKS